MSESLVTTRSLALWEEALDLIPGGVNSPVRAFKSVGGSPIFFERGEGAWLISTTGERYLDFTSGVAVNALGHCHPHLVAALQEQVGREPRDLAAWDELARAWLRLGHCGPLQRCAQQPPRTRCDRAPRRCQCPRKCGSPHAARSSARTCSCPS